MTTEDYLRTLCSNALERLQLSSAAAAQMDYELEVIEASGLSNYFLIVCATCGRRYHGHTSNSGTRLQRYTCSTMHQRPAVRALCP